MSHHGTYPGLKAQNLVHASQRQGKRADRVARLVLVLATVLTLAALAYAYYPWWSRP